MRYAFGLVGLLVCVAIMMKLSADSAGPVTKAGAKAQQDVQQMAGRDAATGGAATDALTLERAERNGRLTGMTVKAVAPGSAMQTYYGLLANDVITQAGEAPLADPFVGDTETASAFILKAYQEKRDLTVQRGGQRLTLPQPAAAAATPPPSTTADPLAAPAPTPASTPPAQPGGLQRQLDIIRNSGGQRE